MNPQIREIALQTLLATCIIPGSFTGAGGQTLHDKIDTSRLLGPANPLPPQMPVGQLMAELFATIYPRLPWPYLLFGPANGAGQVMFALRHGMAENALYDKFPFPQVYETPKEGSAPPMLGHKPGSLAVAVEDIVTTGGTLLRSIQTVRGQGFKVTHALCVATRTSQGVSLLAQNSVTLLPLFCQEEVLPAPGLTAA